MNAPETALPGKHTGAAGQLYMAFELSDKKWLLVVSDGARGPSRYTVDAGDKRAVLDAIAKAKARCGLVGEVVVRSCYEAGRDGFWLHRWLLEQGIDNIVVDSASIEVNRRARRAKTDRLDGGKLLTMLMRYLEGERRVWSVVRVPTPQEEDARRAHRELEQLRHERTAHSNRIGALLVLHNLRVKHVGGRDWGKWWARHGPELPAALRAGIEREMTRLVLVKAQIKTLEAQQCTEVATGLQPQAAQLSRVRGVGLGGAWILVKELFGWRRFHNRRQVAGCIGLAPTPYSSGDSQTERGIAKAGNKRARRIMVELGWSWLRYQPESDLSQWFNQRFAHGGKRMRRIGIVALARRLAIALWRYLEHGVIPAGATLKPIPLVGLEPVTP
jgi:transposase